MKNKTKNQNPLPEAGKGEMARLSFPLKLIFFDLLQEFSFGTGKSCLLSVE